MDLGEVAWVWGHLRVWPSAAPSTRCLLESRRTRPAKVHWMVAGGTPWAAQESSAGRPTAAWTTEALSEDTIRAGPFLRGGRWSWERLGIERA